jgi:beta-phosphoglucomutase
MVGWDFPHMPAFDAILFDFDGVLLDSEPAHYDCWLEALAPFGVTFDWDYWVKHCVGMDDRTMLHKIAADARPPRTWDELWACYPAKKAAFRRRMLANPPFLPELTGLLERLSVRYKLAVVTSSGRTEIEPLLEAGGLRRYFSALVCGRDVERRKPAPDPYLLAAKQLGAKRPLVVEDSAPGIASARAAGFEVLVVKSPEEVPGLLCACLEG